MGVAPQGIKGLSRYFGTVRQSVEAGQEAASAAVGTIIDTLANGPAGLVRQDPGSSVISSEMHVSGTLLCSGGITIDGTLIGDIRSKGHVIVGLHGVVLGNIYADEVTVRGRTEGILSARKVRLCRSSHVKGEVVRAYMEIEHGAFFEGDCSLGNQPSGALAAARQ